MPVLYDTVESCLPKRFLTAFIHYVHRVCMYVCTSVCQYQGGILYWMRKQNY
jgi:hypothetical protein